MHTCKKTLASLEFTLYLQRRCVCECCSAEIELPDFSRSSKYRNLNMWAREMANAIQVLGWRARTWDRVRCGKCGLSSVHRLPPLRERRRVRPSNRKLSTA